MKRLSDPQFLPYLRKTWRLYLFIAIIALLYVLIFHRQLTEFFISRSKQRAIFLFFLLPLLALLTKPHGTERAIGIIYAVREKEWAFFRITLVNWALISIGAFSLALLLYYLESYALLVGFANWAYCFAFLVFLVNLIPLPPPPKQHGARLPITVWGPKQCGKTVFIGMLYDDLVDKKWIMDPTDTEAHNYIINIRGTLTGGQWPQNTMPLLHGDQVAESFVFHFSRRWSWYPYLGLRYFSIRMPDPSGEIFRKVENVKTGELPAFRHTFFESMGQSAGSLFIISIQSSEDTAALRKELEANLTHMQLIRFPHQPGRKLPFPVAIAISQVDRVYDQYIQNRKQPEEWFERRFGSDLLQLFRGRVREFKIFYFSAIGVKEVDGRMVPRTHLENGEEVPDPELRPFGLFEPVKWLLKRSRKYMAGAEFRRNANSTN
jgi:hypothetical protein